MSWFEKGRNFFKKEGREVDPLQERIDLAFTNAEQVVFVRDNKLDDVHLDPKAPQQNHEEAAIVSMPDHGQIIFPPWMDKPHQVSVRDPSDYSEVIRRSLEKIIADPEERISIGEEMVKHELAHGEAALQYPTVNSINYGVSFARDSNTGIVRVTPFMYAEGTMTKAELREMRKSPEHPSDDDKRLF